MEKPLLNDIKTYPDDGVLKKVLGKNYVFWTGFLEFIGSKDLGLGNEWRYYKDGGAWLNKTTFKDKTLCWISVWDGFFKAACYFGPKDEKRVAGSPIDKKLKAKYTEIFKSGKKFIPLTVDIKTARALKTARELVLFKKSNK